MYFCDCEGLAQSGVVSERHKLSRIPTYDASTTTANH